MSLRVQAPVWTLSFPDSVVAAAATRLSAPGVGVGFENNSENADVDAFLQRTRHELGIDETDFSEDALERVDIFISHEIDRRLSEGFDETLIKEDLGEQGSLPLGAYSVESTHLFKEVFDREKLKFAAGCITRADMVQHFFSPLLKDDENRRLFSFFASRREHNRKDAWILVMTERRGATLRVLALFRLPIELYNNSVMTSPIDMLRGLALRYGAELTLNGVPLGRQWVQAEYFDKGDELSYKDGGPGDVAFHLMRRTQGDKVFYEFASAINMSRYRADLLKV